MITRYTVFDAAGRLLYNISTTPELRYRNVEDSHIVKEGWHDDSYYLDVKSGEVKNRPDHGILADKTSITADGVDQCALTGIATSAEVTIAGPLSAQHTVTDNSFSFSTDFEGVYAIQVTDFPKQDYRTTIDAN